MVIISVVVPASVVVDVVVPVFPFVSGTPFGKLLIFFVLDN